MIEQIRQAALSEIMLLFVLIFIMPAIVILLFRLRRYETLYGELEPAKKNKAEKKKKDELTQEKENKPLPALNNFPYQKRTMLQPPERNCLKALEEVMGDDTRIFAKVAISQLIETSDVDPGYNSRLSGKYFDFLLCEYDTCQPFTAIMLVDRKQKNRGQDKELDNICEAAEMHVIKIPAQDSYTAEEVRKIIGLPDI